MPGRYTQAQRSSIATKENVAAPERGTDLFPA